jgi:transcriptional regulator with XRE-family HTH domain
MPARNQNDRSESMLDSVDLGNRVLAKRRSKGLSIREAAKEAGVSAPTFSRTERGQHLPDRENLLRIAKWADVRIDPVVHGLQRRRNVAVHGDSASTSEAVELHLRADKNLAREDADALAQMFRVAYDALASKQQRSR